MSPFDSLSAAEACTRLGVKPATLYSYVSRGLVRSEPVGGSSRERRYNAEDVAALVERQAARKDPQRAIAEALHSALDWGGPILDSALTHLTASDLSYRGQRVTDLAEWASVEEVAALLWTGETDGWRTLPLRLRLHLGTHARAALPLEALAYALAHAGAHDVSALDTRPEALPTQAARVLNLLYATLERHFLVPPAPDLPLHIRLGRAWNVHGPNELDLLRRALVLLADHELNVSTFAACVTASGRCSLHHATLAALCALQGPRHGLAVLDCTDLLTHAAQTGVRPALRDGIRRLGYLPGFGHKVYAAGDVRGKSLLDALENQFPAHPAVQLSGELRHEVKADTGEAPNIDLALATLMRVLGRDGDDGVTLFALARAIGWLAHAQETLLSGQMIRPRARYVGLTAP